MELTLAPSASVLLIFEKSREGSTYTRPELNGDGTEIKGPWRLKLNHVNGQERQITLRKLVDFRDRSYLKTFAGEAMYTKEIQIDKPGGPASISLGNVQGISELILNGQSMGVKWYGDHVYDVTGKLTKGENTISVRITTIAGNYLKSLEENPTAQRWTRGQPYYSVGMMGPVKLYQSPKDK